MQHRNLTLKLDADLYKQLETIAAQHDTSISALVARKLAELVEEETEYAEARAAALVLLKTGLDLGTYGQIDVPRDELHDR